MTEPSLRLFVLPTDLVAVLWSSRLLGYGPARQALRGHVERDVGVAEATELDDELALQPLTPFDDEAVERVARWAAAVGYQRLWLPGLLLPLDPADVDLGPLTIRCTTCAYEVEERGLRFWEMVRANRVFPLSCPVCGGVLVQPVPSLDATAPRSRLASERDRVDADRSSLSAISRIAR